MAGLMQARLVMAQQARKPRPCFLRAPAVDRWIRIVCKAAYDCNKRPCLTVLQEIFGAALNILCE
jgi:hypothetical protein